MEGNMILDNLLKCTDRELAEVMRYIRIDGEPVVSVQQLRSVLRAEKKQFDIDNRRNTNEKDTYFIRKRL